MTTPTMIDLFVSRNTADWTKLITQKQVYTRASLKALPAVMPNEFDMYLHEKLKPHDQIPEKYFYDSVLNLPETHKTAFEKHKHFSHFVRSTPIPVRPVYFRDINIPVYIWYAKIDEILSKIPGIRYTWDGQNFQWRIETADITPPPEYGKSLQEQAIMRQRRIVSYEAAIRGHCWLYAVYPLETLEGITIIQKPAQSQWGCASICMFADKGGIWVDGCSPTGFIREVIDTFSSLLKTHVIKQRLFLTRFSYLQFFESMSDEEYNHSNPVHRYIYDQHVGQEICSYM